MSQDSCIPAALPLLLALSMLGCIGKETSHVLYLEPDGAVTWTVLDRDVRADDDDPATRRRVEAGYIEAARSGEFRPALALAELGARDVRCQVLRDSRPFEVRAEGRFDSLAELGRALIEATGQSGDSWVELEEIGGRWVVEIELPFVDEPDESVVEAHEHLEALVEDAEDYRLLVGEGRLVTAEGLEIESGGQAARFRDRDPDEEGVDGVLTWSLTWTTDAGT